MRIEVGWMDGKPGGFHGNNREGLEDLGAISGLAGRKPEEFGGATEG